MKRIVFLWGGVIVWFFSSASGTAFSASVNMQEGEWETTIETTMEGEGISMPPMVTKVRHCLSPDHSVPNMGDKNCKVTKMKVAGNTVSWKMVCVDGTSKSEGDGEVTYRGTTYTGVNKMKIVDGEDTMSTLMKLSGRRLGVCTGKKTRVTSKDMEKHQAMAEQAKARSDAEMARLKTPSKRGAEILKAPVPSGEKDACVQDGFQLTPKCKEKNAAFNFRPGKYEVVVSKISKTGEFYSSVEEKKEVLSLKGSGPVPPGVLPSVPAGEVHWGREKITWSRKGHGESERGGIIYKGTSFEGVINQTVDLASGMTGVVAIQVTGRRVGDEDIEETGRDYTAERRGYTSQPKKKTAVEQSKDLLKNPVKGLRNLLGY